jgi:predicted nucleic acid-binding Zn ribbon protein
MIATTTTTPYVCIECGAPITRGSRPDKRFCSDNCKNEYHNAIKVANSREIRQILAILKRNREILKSILGNKPEVIVPRELLLKQGFEFDYHTHHVISRIRQNEFIFSFNYGYRVLEKDLYKIVKGFE